MESNGFKRTSRLAIASIICIILGAISFLLFCLSVILPMEDVGHFVGGAMILFPLAFVLGIISLIVITIRRKYLKGYIIAILAIILSLPAIYLDYKVDQGIKARIERSKENTGTYNLNLLGKELKNYAKTHDGHLPLAESWCDLLMQNNMDLIKDTFKHPLHPSLSSNTPPSLKLYGDCNFAFNKRLSGLSLDEISNDTVLLFEANGDWNLSGGSELLETRRDKHKAISVMLTNGTMQRYMFYYEAYRDYKSGKMKYKKLRWSP